MYHVEIRQRSHVARAFNLSEQELRRTVLAPLAAGGAFRFADRDWDARDARVRVLEGPRLGPSELMLGRGWPNAERSGTDVTERLVQRSRAEVDQRDTVQRLKERIVGRIAAGPLALAATVGLADDLLPGGRTSARLAAAEQAAWELLHEGRAQLLDLDGARLAREEWEACLLRWDSWSQATDSAISLARSASDANR